MDTLIAVIISGMAVAYLTEIVNNVSGDLFSPRVVKLILPPPLSFLFMWFLNFTQFELVVGGLAAGFFSLMLLRLVNRPAILTNLNNRR